MRSLAAFSSLALALAVAPAALAQAPVYGQCGGQGWTGATTCASGSVCTVSNPYYSQCLPGAAPAPSSTSKPPASSSPPPASSSPPPATTTAPPATSSVPPASSKPPATTTGLPSSPPTQVPGQLFIRAVEAPNFHFYLQSNNVPGDAVITSYLTAAQFNIVNGQLIQYTPSGTKLYANILPPVNGTTRMKMTFVATPPTNVTFSFSGDALNVATPGFTQKQGGIWLACNDVSTTSPNVYLNLGNFDYLTPANCADETLNYYNATTPSN